MKKLKTKLGLAAIIGLTGLATTTARAQQYFPIPIGANAFDLGGINGGTNNVAGNSTNTYNFPIDVRQYGDFGLEISWSLLAPGTSNVVFNFSHSVTSNYWVPVLSLVVPAQGTNVVVTITNPVVNSVGWWLLTTVVNTNTPALTNLSVTPVKKPRISSIAPNTERGTSNLELRTSNLEQGKGPHVGLADTLASLNLERRNKRRLMTV